MKTFKKALPDIIVIAVFVIISVAYFFPADIEGRILYRHDSSAGRGIGQETSEYREQTGKVSRWTNSAFSGMPTYQIAPSYKSAKILTNIEKVLRLWLGENVWNLFAYLLGFYILLRAFNFRSYLAALGAVIWAFSSYFLIIIAAGHMWKAAALAYIPPMTAGIVLSYRGKFSLGLIVTALYTALEIISNHVQMTYYHLFVLLFMVIAFFVDAILKRQLIHFAKATAIVILGGILGLCINLPNLYHTWQYSKESMRGKSELRASAGQIRQDQDLSTTVSTNSTNGLDRDYITQWSYGISETWTLLIPNAKGGAHSIKLGDNENAIKKAPPAHRQYIKQWYQYWGEQPFTAGPVYVGAFVIVLFFLGCIIVKGPMKWALVVATVLSILLSWGKNFMPFTDFFIDHVPMYAKFRTVSSALVIAEFTIPLLAMLGLKELINSTGEHFKRNMRKAFLISGITSFVCFLFALLPTAFFNFTSSLDAQQLASTPNDFKQQFLSSLTSVRAYVFTSDCLRSFFIIAIGVLFLTIYYRQRQKVREKQGSIQTNTLFLVIGLFALCFVDMWTIDKRYLNDSMFVDNVVREKPLPITSTISSILKEGGSDYFRCLNLSTDTFNENETSYYLKSIGGYHAAKLHRYQDLIEAYLHLEIKDILPSLIATGGDMNEVKGDSLFPVLNMLNTRYFILPLQSGQTIPITNPYAFGNAWFANKITFVDNADEELRALGNLNLQKEAVADKKFAGILSSSGTPDSTASVILKEYSPNHLVYNVSSKLAKKSDSFNKRSDNTADTISNEDRVLLVFSEIYYPGWTATVDGKDVPVGRVNYVLRAISLEPGEHTVELMFYPKSVEITESIAYVSYVILLGILLGLMIIYFYRKYKQKI